MTMTKWNKQAQFWIDLTCEIDINDMGRDLAYDLDDGIGQDAWMLFKPLVSGDYFLQIEGSGNFFGEEGTYTVLVYEADMVDDDTEIMYEIGADGSCEVINESLTIEAVEKSVYEGTDAEFLIRGPGDLADQFVNLYYEYVGYDDYFESSSPSAGPHPVQLTTFLQQSDGVWEVNVATVSDMVIEEKPGSVTITIEPDDPVEPNDPVYTVGYPRSATVYVVDNDGAPSLSAEAVRHRGDPVDPSDPDGPRDPDLPLWEAVVSWELPKDVDDSQVTLWDVDYSRTPSCVDTPKYWIGPGYTAPGLRKTSFQWFASDVSIHFRVRALFKGGVYGPWSDRECEEAPGPEVPDGDDTQPPNTISFEFLKSGDLVLNHHWGRGTLFPLDIVFDPAVGISRAELYGALHVEEGKIRPSDVIWAEPYGDDGETWAIFVRPRTNTSIMKITLYCDPPADPNLLRPDGKAPVKELRQCTGPPVESELVGRTHPAGS